MSPKLIGRWQNEYAQYGERAFAGASHADGWSRQCLAIEVDTSLSSHIESFNGRFRAECLSQEWFLNLPEVRQTVGTWRLEYNTARPHSSLAYLPPAVWAKQQQTL